MRFLIVGAGGVGGYFGGRLAQAGEDVTFVARGQHLAAIEEHGLRVDSVRGDFVVHPARVVSNAVEAGEVDCIIAATKTWQLSEAAELIRPLVGRGSVVLPLQNGVEAPAQLAALLGGENVLGGVAKIFSYIEAPGHIRHVGGAASITFGELDKRRTARVERLLEVLSGAGIATDIADDIAVAMWRKFLFVTPLGGVGAVTRAPIGVIRSLAETRRLMEEGMREILCLARAEGIGLPDDAVAQTMAFVDAQPGEGTSSLQRDIAEGRPSELEAWSGAVVRLAAAHGMDAPVHRFLYAALLPQEKRAVLR